MFTSVDDIRTYLKENGEVATLVMEDVKTAWDSPRLKPFVRQRMMEDLDREGIGHYCDRLGMTDLPDSQRETVRLYLKRSDVGVLIDAALRVSSGNDRRLRDAAASKGSQRAKQLEAIIAEIRDLVEPEEAAS